MTSATEDGRAADHDRDARAPEQAPSGGTGDLEFDEAWGGAAGAPQGAAPRPSRDPDPTFEDPNDR